MSKNNVAVLKTEQMETSIDKFVQTVDDMQDLVEVETLDAIKGLLEMGTIRNWGLLVRTVFDSMKGQMAAKIDLANKAREAVNK